MNERITQGQELARFKDTDTNKMWYIVFELEGDMDTKQVTYGPFLTEREAREDMPRVLGMYTSLRAIG